MFDSRTSTIRQAHRRDYAIGTRLGLKFQVGGHNYLVSRPYNRKYQRWRYVEGTTGNFRNAVDKCMDVIAMRDVYNQPLCSWHCSGNMNQAFTVFRPPAFKPNYPLQDKIKFHIRSKFGQRRAIERTSHYGGNRYYLQMKEYAPSEELQMWVFDSRTKSIREATRRNYAIGFRTEITFQTNRNAFLNSRPYDGKF